MLLVTFHKLDGSRIQTHLHLSPHVEQLFGVSVNKSIPSLNTQGCLMDYIPEVRKMLCDKVETVTTNHRKKYEFMSYLFTRHASSVIEYDTLTFSKMTLLFSVKNFHWLLIIHLGKFK